MATKDCVACAEEINANAKLCKHCGVMQDDERFLVPKAEKPKTAKVRASHICPKCESADAVSSVAAIVDGGTSNSASLTMMNQFGHPLNIYSGVTVGSSSSALAQRFAIYVPESSFRYVYLLAGIIASTWLLWKLWFHAGGVADCGSLVADFVVAGFISLFVGPLLGMILGFIAKAAERKSLEPQRQAAFSAIERLRSSYYCSRDDLVFKGNKSGSPEDYIAKLLGY